MLNIFFTIRKDMLALKKLIKKLIKKRIKNGSLDIEKKRTLTNTKSHVK